MLHLIKDNKLDLFELDMDLLTDQYLHYLNAMESMHLEIASEYLAELAGLIEYKSKKLLRGKRLSLKKSMKRISGKSWFADCWNISAIRKSASSLNRNMRNAS